MILKAFLKGIKSHVMTVISTLGTEHAASSQKASWIYLFFLITKSIKLFKLVLLLNTTKRVRRDHYRQMASGI